jgi:hypothetical protein
MVTACDTPARIDITGALAADPPGCMGYVPNLLTGDKS